jgi:hypothetical protein
MVDSEGEQTENIPVSGQHGCQPQKGALLFFVAVTVIFLSRLPLLGIGYGSQADAWRVAVTASSIALAGEYSASRLPGYPLQEFVCSLLWRGGPWALNGMTALFSGIAVGFFLLSMRLLGSRDYIAGSLALGFVPVVYVSSTMSLDNIWALSFILGGFYFVLSRRPIGAGIFLGLAIGCRITSGIMIIPLSLLLAQGQNRGPAVRQVLRFCLTAGMVGAAAFTPVVGKYGWRFFTFYEPTGYPRLLEIMTRATVDVWGTLGLVAILIVAVSCLIDSRKLRSISFKPVSKAAIQFAAYLLVIALYFISYLRLPHQARYLIPIIPFVIIVFDRILSRRIFWVFCIIVMLSSFVSIGRSGFRPGPIFSEYAARKADMELTRQVISRANELQKKSLIVAGWWLPRIKASLPTQSPDVVDYVYSLDASELRQRISQGFNVFYLPGIREYNHRMLWLDLAKFGATPLLLDSQQ